MPDPYVVAPPVTELSFKINTESPLSDALIFIHEAELEHIAHDADELNTIFSLG